MAAEELARLVVEALYLALLVSAPALGAAMLTGALTGVLSAATQVQEPSLSYVPKLVGVAVALAVAGGWMASQLIGFTDQLWRAIPTLVAT
ncbi:MAG: flagellar biosynthetic protein FliQ [Sandaracinaceae bacterium]